MKPPPVTAAGIVQRVGHDARRFGQRFGWVQAVRNRDEFSFVHGRILLKPRPQAADATADLEITGRRADLADNTCRLVTENAVGTRQRIPAVARFAG
jgi:hypothetical protein